ncbi:MAG TPA: M15 family metallopeptidase [Candidatus Saccharimonadales bacterium]|jgi:D-alanyl-D-alanine carboxypeptidase
MRVKLAALIVVIIVLAGGTWWRVDHDSTAKPHAAATAKTTAQVGPSSSFNKKQYSLTDPTSIWVIANKQHPLNPVTYTPPDLTVPNVPLAQPGADNMQMRTVTATAIEKLFTAAKQAGVNLEVVSAYRSYTYQQTVYNRYVTGSGQAAADQESARPGYSEHQTGLAVDIGAVSGNCELSQCFGTTPEGEWLAANAYKYGFLLRYPADKVAVTGYEYEPWHFRYIGTDLSGELQKDHAQTLEEFFGVSGGTTYKAAG